MRLPKIDTTYQHCKGSLYRVLAIATHSETDEMLVIYRSLKDGSLWARPAGMWFEKVETEHGPVDRFLEF